MPILECQRPPKECYSMMQCCRNSSRQMRIDAKMTPDMVTEKSRKQEKGPPRSTVQASQHQRRGPKLSPNGPRPSPASPHTTVLLSKRNVEARCLFQDPASPPPMDIALFCFSPSTPLTISRSCLRSRFPFLSGTVSGSISCV
jgi:hypothetical protein